MDIVIAVARDVDDTLSSFYVGYDFSAGKEALVQTNPHIGWTFRGDPSTAAFVTLRTAADNPPEPPVNGAPVITDISPSSVPGGSYDTTITIKGQNFEQGMQPYFGDHVSWIDPMLYPIFLSDTQVTGVIPAANLGAPTSFKVFIVNPDGEDSNDVDFTVT
jgi:hypothetical protein